MTPDQFKRKYRAAIAPQFDRVKDPTPELLKAMIDLERMVSELCGCNCGSAPANPCYPPKIPDWLKDPPKSIRHPTYDFPPLVCRGGVVG